MTIKERIKDFDKAILCLQKIIDNTDELDIKLASLICIEKLKEIKEIFILSVTYSEVN